MTDKLRDALAGRLDKFFEEATDRHEHPTTMQYVASRLLESVPGEEELALKLLNLLYRHECDNEEEFQVLLEQEKRIEREHKEGKWKTGSDAFEAARFLRQHIGWWVE